jgi:restriction system protein
MTVFSATRNNAEGRLRAVLANGVDPGWTTAASAPTDGVAIDASEPVDPVPAITVEAIRDRVRTFLAENFAGHKLTGLIADIMRAQGYTCDVSPAGPDFGVDILAGRGPLGLDSPTVVVEVKSESSQIGVPVLNQLQGAVTSHQADQALLVAWGGLSKQAEQLRLTQRLKVRVWTDEDVLDHLFATYGDLPEATRAALPLKQAWVLVQETG